MPAKSTKNQIEGARKFIAGLLAALEKGEKKKGKGNGYIFRGIEEDYADREEYNTGKGDDINSGLYRFLAHKQGKEHFVPHRTEKAIVEKAKMFFPHGSSPVEILTDLRHYGGTTNLIDFSENVHIALFFACKGVSKTPGKLIVLEKQKIAESINYDEEEFESKENAFWIVRPAITQDSKMRVHFQSSVFVRPRRGYIDKEICKIKTIVHWRKQPILDYLEKYHAITTDSVYRDLIGYIGNKENSQKAVTNVYLAPSTPQTQPLGAFKTVRDASEDGFKGDGPKQTK